VSNDKKIAIISHDAGGAEILSSYVRQQKSNYLFSLKGPALEIFSRKLGLIVNMPTCEAIDASEVCICGTGWQTDFEWEAMRYARQVNKHVVAYLDHWVNYLNRFERNGIKILPNEIWVGDCYAEDIARKIFLETNIANIEKPYFIDIKNSVLSKKDLYKENSDQKRIIFIGENISEHAKKEYGSERHWGYTELDALSYLIEGLERLGCAKAKIVIRPHPSENKEKYEWAITKYPNISFSRNESLIDEILSSDIVAGCESVALVVGILAMKKVISCIPKFGRPCVLPHKEIVHLKELF